MVEWERVEIFLIFIICTGPFMIVAPFIDEPSLAYIMVPIAVIYFLGASYLMGHHKKTVEGATTTATNDPVDRPL